MALKLNLIPGKIEKLNVFNQFLFLKSKNEKCRYLFKSAPAMECMFLNQLLLWSVCFKISSCYGVYVFKSPPAMECMFLNQLLLWSVCF